MKTLELKITENSKHFKQPLKMEDRFSETEKGKIAKAAKDFETLMTSMLIKNMTESNGGLFGADQGMGTDVLDTVFENELAGHLTKNSGLGIAQMIYKKLTGEDYSNDLLKLNIKKPSTEIKPTNYKLSSAAFDRLKQYEPIIAKAAEEHGVDSKLIKSVILTESAANPKAVSRANAKGLMQLMDTTASDMGVKNSFDPEENIFGGTKYLSKMLRQYNGDVDKALAAYNAGPANVNKYDGIPPFAETQNYVKRVQHYLNKMDE